MQTILNDQEIKSVYSTADEAGKQLLQKVLGKELFSIDLSKIKSFEDGLALKGITAGAVLPVVPTYMKDHEKSQHAFAKLIFLGDIFRDGWTADFSNSKQYKYWPWWIYRSGSGLSLGGVAYVGSRTCVASRLCFPTRGMAETFANQFQAIWNDYIL